MIGIGIGIIPRTSVTSVSVVTATIATGIGITSFTANWNAFSGAQYYLLDVSLNSSFSTFVYQDQVVLAPTTAYVVIGLTENTTYYYRVRASTDAYIDPDYLAFFNRVVAAGGFLTIAEQDSTKQLVADLKANSLWTPMKAIYPMVGSSAASCAQNLKSASFTGTFTSGWTFASTGVSGNGTSAYFDTTLIPLTDLSQNNLSGGYYIGNNYNAESKDILCTGSGSSFFGIFNAGGNEVAVNDGFASTVIPTKKNGLFTFSRISSSQSKLYANNLQTFTATLASATPNIYSVKIACLNQAGVNSRYSTNSIRFAHLGDGLTDTQASNFYTAVQKFNQSLNRQVGAQVVSDADAQAYIDRVYTAGGTLTNTEATAVNQLTIDLKSNGTWSSMKAIYPMIGASAAACAQNLRSSSFTGTFTAGWTFASTGATPNGTSAYMNTNLNPNTQITITSTHLSIYHYTGTAKGWGFGCVNAGYNPSYAILPRFVDSKGYVSIGSTYSSVTNSNGQGFYIATRNSNTQKLFKNNSTIVTGTDLGVLLPNYNLYMSCVNIAGSASEFDDKTVSFGSLGDGLTDTQASDFYTSVQKFNQTLDRQVGAQIVSDLDAQSYINRVYTAGGTLTNLEANAVNKLAIDMKAAGLWTSMKAVYPMIGSSAASCAQNLKSSSFTGTFTSNWVFSATGATPNGSSDYFNTTFNPTGNLSVNSQCYGYYSRSNTAAGSKREMGGYNSLSLGGNEDLGLLIKFTGDIFYSVIGGTTFPSVANTDSRGLFIMNRTSGTNVKGYKNNSLLINATQSTVILLNMPIYIGCRNTNTTPSDFTDRECAFSSIGDGLTDTQSSNFYTLVQSFNQTLGRSVGSQIVSDADAQAYVNRVYNAGGSLTNTEANAVNQLVLDMKTAGIWTSMKAVYPMVGSSAAACAQNLKSSSFTGTFTAGWTFTSSGATPNGTSAYFDTNLVPSTSLLLDSVSLSFYSRTNTQGDIQMGVNDTSNYLIQQMYSSTQMYSQLNGAGGSFIDAPVTQFQGLFTTSRTSNIAVAAYKNGTNIKNDVKSSSSRPVLNFYIGARNNNNSAGNFDNKQCAFASIGDGLTDVQATALYNATQIFQNTLGRAV